MAKLPSISSRKAIKALTALGWQKVRQTSSHIILVKEGELATLSVPDHNPVAKGTLRKLLRAAGITVEDFVDVLKKGK